jgi:hypothetical protein
MRMWTVGVFAENDDADPLSEWGVIADNAQDAERLLREHFAPRPDWKKIEALSPGPQEIAGPAAVVGPVPPD